MFNIFIQSVEEAECQRAYETSTEVYMSTFDRSKPPEEVSIDFSCGCCVFLFYYSLNFEICVGCPKRGT